MSTKAVHETGTEKVTLSGKINDFLVKNRGIIITILAVFVCVFIALAAVTVITENKNNSAYETVETVMADWETAKADPDKTALAEKEDSLIARLQKVATSNKASYAGARASMSIAEIYFSRKDWKLAGEFYLAAAKAAPRAYTAGLNYYNAAVCADELGNQDEAIANFNLALGCENFRLKSRALFNIGRIEEQRSNKEAAITSYEKLASQYPDDEWALIAKSRILALQIQ